MMIGEYEFEGIFTEHHNRENTETENALEARNNPFPVYSGLVFVVFVFVMTIIIMNMLVGLAVDDIVEIQNNAQFSKLSLNVGFFFSILLIRYFQARLVLESERFLQPMKRILSTSFLNEYTKNCLVLPRYNIVTLANANVKHFEIQKREQEFPARCPQRESGVEAD